MSKEEHAAMKVKLLEDTRQFNLRGDRLQVIDHQLGQLMTLLFGEVLEGELRSVVLETNGRQVSVVWDSMQEAHIVPVIPLATAPHFAGVGMPPSDEPEE